MVKLLVALNKQMWRNKEAIFWSLVFPMLFMLIFKLFDFSGSVNAHIIVIDQANNDLSKQLISTLNNVRGVGINTDFTDQEKASEELKNSQSLEFRFIDTKNNNKEKIDKATVNVVMVVDSNFGKFETLASDPSQKFKIDLIYNQADEGQASPSGIVQSIIDEFTTQLTMRMQNVQSPFETQRQGISVHDIKYYDVLVPGIMGMGVMQSSIIGMAAAISTYKEKRILKRLSATPLPIWKFLFASVATNLILIIVQITIMVVMAKFVLGANIYGSIPLMYVISLLGSFIFLSLGFVAAAVTKTSNAAQSLASVLTTPMMFLSGVFFVREGLPKGVRYVADYLPLSPVLDALRGISLQSKGLMDIKMELLVILIWFAVSFVLAAKLFKFREE